ncbi:SMC domain-containing protein [Nitrosotalea devaniterrae]|uniref:SMC domain-containing protein n=1 Tax=Nitrosotalea devaniterrae TaxID=1078905 RepID=A0A128A3Q3_9ARCH|nr:SMC domain-containing protein [Candidatus Nitrosotalea devanaterra]
MLQSIELENFLSHKNTKLTFDRGVTVFVGQNGAGKSSIIDAITFALFGEHVRKSTKGLLRRGTNQAYAKVEFSIGNRQFEAVRKIDSKGTVGAVLHEKINGELVPLAAGERKQFGESMTKTIESLIGLDYEKLKVASIVQQGELQTIIEADPKKFKELVNAIIGIDKLDMAFESMKKTIDVFRTTVKSRLGYDDTSIDALQNRIDALSKEISSLEPQKKKLEADKITQEHEFFALQQNIESEIPKEMKIKELENKKEDLLRYLRNSIVSMKRELVEKERKFAECSNSLSILSFKSQVESDMKQTQTEIDRIDFESKKTGEKIATIQGQQDIANRLHLVDGKCPVCDSKVDRLNPLFDEKHITSELETLKKNTELLTRDKITVQSKKRELDMKLQQIIKAEGVLLMNNVKSQDDLINMREEISKLQVNTKDIPLEISVGNLVQYAIDEYSTDAIKSISTLVRETQGFDVNNFRNLKSKLEQQRRILSTLDQEVGAVNTKLRLHKDESEKIVLILSELQDVKQYVSSLETIRSQIYNRDGPVATSLRSWALNTISQKASDYLSTFNVKIQRITLEDKSRDIGITCYSGNLELDLESLSGGEKVSVALALRLGMAHFMGSSNLNFIILDEPTTHLDQERRKSLVNVLAQAFESNIDAISQFIIITHDSEIFENSNIDAIYDFKSTPEGTVVTPI